MTLIVNDPSPRSGDAPGSPQPGRPASIRAHLVALAIAVAVPLLGVFGWLLAALSDESHRSAGLQAQLLAARSASRLDVTLRGHAEQLERLQLQPLVRALDAERCDPMLRGYAESRPAIVSITLADARGEPVCTASSEPGAAVTALDSGWLREGLTHAEFHVGRPRADPAGRWLVPLSNPVLGDSAAKAGVIVAVVDLLRLQQLLFDAIPPQAIVNLLDRDGRVLMRSSGGESWIGRVVPAQFNQRLHAAAGGTVVTAGLDGRVRLYAPVPLPGTSWLMVAGVPEAEAQARQRTMLWRSGAAAGLALLLALALGG